MTIDLDALEKLADAATLYIECIHCHEETTSDDFGHWESCPKHPARKVVDNIRAQLAAKDAVIAEMREALKKIRDEYGPGSHAWEITNAVLAKYPEE